MIYMILINSNELKNQGVLPKEKYATKYSLGPKSQSMCISQIMKLH